MLTFGIDMGGTNVRCAVVDADGRIVADVRRDTPAGWNAVVNVMAALISELRACHPEASAVGVGVAGLVDEEGTVHYAPNIPGLINAPIRAELAAVVDLPVLVDNDANVAAWGEAVHGAGRGLQHALVITLGTGIGGGVIANGRVYRGSRGFAAEVGHFQIDPSGPQCACGEYGHWEAFASGNALGRMGRERAARGEATAILELAGGDPDKITGVHVGDAAQAGDAGALDLLSQYADYVAIGLAGLANILDPERVIISGGLVELGDVLLDPLRASFVQRVEGSQYRPVMDIVPAALGEHAGVIGAAAMARELR